MRILYQIFFITVISFIFSSVNAQDFNAGRITGNEVGYIEIERADSLNPNYVNIWLMSDYRIDRTKLVLNIYKDKIFFKSEIHNVDIDNTGLIIKDYYFEPGHKYYIDVPDPVAGYRLFYCREFEIPLTAF